MQYRTDVYLRTSLSRRPSPRKLRAYDVRKFIRKTYRTSKQEVNFISLPMVIAPREATAHTANVMWDETIAASSEYLDFDFLIYTT